MKNRTKLPNIYLGVITFITYVPIILTVIYSFNESKISSKWDGFSLKWYAELFRDRDMGQALINSLILATSSAVLAAVIGTLGAVGMSRKQVWSNKLVSYLATMPIMIPEIILGMVFLAVFSFMNLPFGMLTLIIAHTTFCTPYILLNVQASLAGMDKSLEEAARDLGAGPVRTFFDVTLPLIMPGVTSGMLLAFAMSFDDVVISIFVTGARTNILPVKIYTKMKTGVTPEINALATLMLAVSILVLFLASRIRKKHKVNV